MFCMNCGQELPDDASYCLRCGKGQKGNVSSAKQDYETYEILWNTFKTPANLGKKFGRGKGIFYAEAIGPNGRYCAGESPPYQGITYEGEPWYSGGPISSKKLSLEAEASASAAFDELVKKLSAEGWEFVRTEDDWWYKRFRRKLSP